MGYALTERAKNALTREVIEPNIVLSIDGLATLYSVRITSQILKYDIPGLTYDMDLFYDGVVVDSRVKDFVDIGGTTTSISQQLEPDKGSSSSTQTMAVRLKDTNEEISRLISPGVTLSEIMYRNCRLYFGLYETAFPDDYLEIFNGKIMAVKSGPGFIDLTITHPEDLKRSTIFEKAETTLAQDCLFDSALIQGLLYKKRSDVSGNITITYTFAALGDDAIVSVVGNDITVQVDTAFTKIKTVKKKIENDEDANQLVTVVLKADGNTLANTQSITSLSASTEIFVDDVTDFLFNTGNDLFRTYAKINDEIIEYTGIDTNLNKLTGCIRQSLTSLGASHSVGDQVTSFYKLGDGTSTYGNAIDLALTVLISGGDTYFAEVNATRFINIPQVGNVTNGIYIPGVYLVRDYGTFLGDLVTVTGSASNDFSNRTITEIVEIDSGTYLVVNGSSLTLETGSSAVVHIKSQYNLLPDGCAVLPRQIDIAQFQLIKTRYISSIANYEFYLKDTVTSKDFIDKQIFLPSVLYSVPRKGRISLGITAPPLFDPNSKVLSLDNIKNPKDLALNRSVNRNFYNTYVVQYNPDSVEDKTLNKNITISSDSLTRIDAPIKSFKVDAQGLRPGSETTTFINRNALRFLDRYKFGAESIKVDLLLKTGFSVEVGDAVLFGDSSLQLTDTSTGTKDFPQKIYEVTNKEWNWKTGAVSLQLLDTTYSNDVRIGVLSPSSYVGIGSTTTQLVLKPSFGKSSIVDERAKWANYIGKEIIVRSEDWSFNEKTTINSLPPENEYLINLGTALTSAPPEDYIIDIPGYNDIDALNQVYKNVHCFFDPQIAVVSGASSTQFDVNPGDTAKFFVGGIIRVYNEDFSIDSGLKGKKVLSITGDTIECEDLGFTPDSSSLIDLIGFATDNGKPYTWL